VLADQPQLSLGDGEHLMWTVRGVVRAEDRQQALPMTGQPGVDLPGRGRRGAHAEPEGGYGSGLCQAATADWIHVVLLVCVRVGAATCRNTRRTDLGVLKYDVGQQPHERAISFKRGLARLQERLGNPGAAVLDLADVLRRVIDAISERLKRQIQRLATRTKLRPQPRGPRGLGVNRLGRPAATRRHHLTAAAVGGPHELSPRRLRRGRSDRGSSSDARRRRSQAQCLNGESALSASLSASRRWTSRGDSSRLLQRVSWRRPA